MDGSPITPLPSFDGSNSSKEVPFSLGLTTYDQFYSLNNEPWTFDCCE